MPDILQLDNFYLTRVHVDWDPLSPAKKEKGVVAVESQLSVGYVVTRHETNARVFMLKLIVQSRPKEGDDPEGFQFDVQIDGFFHFPDGVSEDDMQRTIRINGGTILYGILRGHLASLTGSFPTGKIVLPTVDFVDIVAKVEGAKHSTAQAGETGAAAPRKRKKRKLQPTVFFSPPRRARK